MLNKQLRKSEFPVEWKMTKLILIEKLKVSKEETKYRPICLLSVMGKMFEQVKRHVTRSVGRGLPQGWMLRPTLFSVMI